MKSTVSIFDSTLRDGAQGHGIAFSVEDKLGAARLLDALGKNQGRPRQRLPLPAAAGEQACTIREAMFSPWERVPAAASTGRVCGAPTVGCPPAVPIAMAGERITPAAAALFGRYGAASVEVLRG